VLWRITGQPHHAVSSAASLCNNMHEKCILGGSNSVDTHVKVKVRSTKAHQGQSVGACNRQHAHGHCITRQPGTASRGQHVYGTHASNTWRLSFQSSGWSRWCFSKSRTTGTMTMHMHGHSHSPVTTQHPDTRAANHHAARLQTPAQPVLLPLHMQLSTSACSLQGASQTVVMATQHMHASMEAP
jgi:hypothetical protein